MTMRTQIHHLVTEAGPAFADRPAVSDKAQSVTYAELADQVRSAGAGLAARVCAAPIGSLSTWTSGSRRWSRMFGASAAGGVFVPVNPLLRPAQVQHILQDSGARVLVTSSERLATLADVSTACPICARWCSSTVPTPMRPLGRGPGPPSWLWGQARRCSRCRRRVGPSGRRPCRDPLHLGQHRTPEGRSAEPPQPHRRGGKRQRLPRQHRRRRDPGRPAAELRRRPQPGDHGPERRGARGAAQLPAGPRRGAGL